MKQKLTELKRGGNPTKLVGDFCILFSVTDQRVRQKIRIKKTQITLSTNLT